MARSRPKRRSPLRMGMRYARSVRTSDCPPLRAHLDAALEGVPEEERMRIARAATPSAPEALRLLDEAERAHDALEEGGRAGARRDRARRVHAALIPPLRAPGGGPQV